MGTAVPQQNGTSIVSFATSCTVPCATQPSPTEFRTHDPVINTFAKFVLTYLALSFSAGSLVTPLLTLRLSSPHLIVGTSRFIATSLPSQSQPTECFGLYIQPEFPPRNPLCLLCPSMPKSEIRYYIEKIIHDRLFPYVSTYNLCR